MTDDNDKPPPDPFSKVTAFLLGDGPLGRIAAEHGSWDCARIHRLWRLDGNGF